MTYLRASRVASSLLSVHYTLLMHRISPRMQSFLSKVIFALITHQYWCHLLRLAYACALSRDILLQGRVYLGQCHVCFYANILGWVTSVVISLNDIVSIEKRSTALIFPNAIQISTLHYRYIFASFLSRDDAYNHLIMAWRQAIGTTVFHRADPLFHSHTADYASVEKYTNTKSLLRVHSLKEEALLLSKGVGLLYRRRLGRTSSQMMSLPAMRG